MNKKILKYFFLTGIALVISLSLAEITLRLFIPKTTLIWQKDQYLGQRLKPNQTNIFVSPTNEYQTEIKVNSHGWHDTEHSIEKPDNTYRILFLGDSFVENFQVPLDKTFFKQIQNNIPEAKGKKAEIIATGLGNTGTAQQLLVLENYSLAYKPDLVIQMFLTANDVANNSPILQNDPYMPYFKLVNNQLVQIPFQKRSDQPLSKFKDFLKKSRIIQLLLDLRQKNRESVDAKKHGYPIDYHIYDNDYSQDYKDAWETTLALITKTKEDVEKTGAKYVLVTLANNEQVNLDVQKELFKTYPKMDESKMDFTKPDKAIADFCQKQSLTCWQMLSFFRNYISTHPGTVTHFHYDGHWNELGTNLAADFLTQNLKSLIGD